MLIRIFIGIRNKGLIENNMRVLKRNYGLHKYHSIESIILEKRLIHNNILFSNEVTAYNVTYL